MPTANTTAARTAPAAKTTEVDESRPSPAEVIDKHTSGFHLPILGRIPLGREQLAFCAGLSVLAVVGVVEWPVVAVIGIGHALTRRHNDGMLAELGEALEEA